MMEKGNLNVLFQPAEVVIIGGAALGGFIIASPPRVLTSVISNVLNIFRHRSADRYFYLDLLSLLYLLFSKAKKDGLVALEADIENPEKSPIFSRFSSVTSDSKLLTFISDNLKVIVSTNVATHELENLIDLELETEHQQANVPSLSIGKLADSLPGLGIVAAVLGVVLTMGKINEPPEVLGHSIGAALVGTFMGVLLCYGFVGPISIRLEHIVRESSIPFQVVKVAIVSFVGGTAPQIAVEFGRRMVPEAVRPTFKELEDTLKRL